MGVSLRAGLSPLAFFFESITNFDHPKNQRKRAQTMAQSLTRIKQKTPDITPGVFLNEFNTFNFLLRPE